MKGTLDNPTTYSSCMTTIESPVNSRFQYCDTKEVYMVDKFSLYNMISYKALNIESDVPTYETFYTGS